MVSMEPDRATSCWTNTILETESQYGETHQPKLCVTPVSHVVNPTPVQVHQMGIKYTPITEGYTSKYCFLDFELLEHPASYAEKHICRRLFCSTKRTLLHTAVNAVYNNIRNVNLCAFDHLIGAEDEVDIGIYPRHLELYAFILPK